MSGSVHLQVESPQGQQDIILTPSEASAIFTQTLRRQNLALNTRCGERSLCDGCLVELLQGQVRHAASGKVLQADGETVVFRACEYRPDAPLIRLRIMARSLLAYEPQVVSDFRMNVTRANAPIYQVHELPPALEPCTLEQRVEQAASLHWPVRAAAGLEAPPADRRVHVTLEYRGDAWEITAASANAPPRSLGAAIDVGTTTVVVMLVDLADGRILARAANFNRQMHLGDDVLTRINLCSTDPTMLGRLQEAIIRQTIGPLLRRTLHEAQASAEQLACLSLAGNTTMLHLLAGVDPSSMGFAPFTPPFIHYQVLTAKELHLPWAMHVSHGQDEPTEEAAPDATSAASHFQHDFSVHLLPGAAAYVGADLTAGVLSSGLAYDTGPSLLVDVGTNGEIILKHGQKLWGCATAAGPAFEGAGLSSGIRAGDGAISHVRLGRDPFTLEIEVIGKEHASGQARPVGICGSAYVDLLGELRRIKLITPTGRLDLAAVPDAAEHLMQTENYGLAFRLAYGHGHKEIILSETDIARLLQAKAAIAAGILTLLERIDLKPADVSRLYLAGGFGMHLRLESAIGCGFFPGFEPEQIQLVGNTSLAGAYLALLDSSAIDEIARIGKAMEIVELNLDPNFEMRYIDQLSLPD